LRQLWESLELEIVSVLEATNRLCESADYELHRLTTQTPAFFDQTVRRHLESLEEELAGLERQADELAKEIEELTGEVGSYRLSEIKRRPLLWPGSVTPATA